MSDDDDIPRLSAADIVGIQDLVTPAPPPSAPPSGKGRVGQFIEAVTRSPTTLQDIHDALRDMTLPKDIYDPLESQLNEIGFKLATGLVMDQYDRRIVRRYTAATRAGVELALLNLPNWFLQMTETIGNFTLAIHNIRDRHGIIISRELPSPASGYENALESMSKREVNSWMFVSWVHVNEIFDGQSSVDQIFKIPPVSATAPPLPVSAITLKQQDKQTIVDLFIAKAAAKAEFFDLVISESDWSDHFKIEMKESHSDDLRLSAWQMFSLLVRWNRYGINGDAYLGRVLVKIISTEGIAVRQNIDKIIQDNGLLTSDEYLQRLKQTLSERG